MKGFLSVSLGFALFAAAGCATQYRFSEPVASDDQAQATIQVQASNPSQSVFQRLRFMVQVRNNTDVEQPFSSRYVTAQLNGKPATVLSYESQIQELRSIIIYYQPFVPEPASWVKPVYGNGYPIAMVFQPVGFESFNDTLDLQNALDDLAYVRANAVRPVTVKPGETYQGEITLLNKLNAEQQQLIELKVQFAGQSRTFQIQATEQR